jgi:4-hydroxy-3-polyprenylbenzoate decarboxylase
MDQSAVISSGSFRTDGMAIVPCSMRTASAIAHGVGDTLVCRAADVTLKEGRKLVLVVRETPLSAIHLENLLTLARLGVVVLPPVPAFYNHPEGIEDLVEHLVVRVLDQFGLEATVGRRWTGILERRAGAADED